MDSNDIEKILGFKCEQSLVLSSIRYPLEQAKIQIQISPNPAYNIQRILTQVKQTYHIAGLQGCYTGFIPWFVSSVTYKFAFHQTRQVLIPNIIKDSVIHDLDDLSEYRRFRRFAHYLGQGITCRTVAVVVSHPFHVVTVRMISELFTEETKYTDLIWSLWKILGEEGLRGLFAGLFPRLLANLNLYSSVATVTYMLHRSLTLSSGARKLLDLMIASIAGFYCCPLSVVSSRMAINNCGIVAGSPPHMPLFVSSYDCWNHLYCT